MDSLFADLHIHTKHSDGFLSPEECVKKARMAGIATISITDHDTTGGIQSAIKEGAKRGIEVIPGIELSAQAKNSNEKEIHILGYYINWEDKHFQEKLKLFRQAREKRACLILEKLKKIGIILDEKRLFETAGIGFIGRLHFAKLMVEQHVVEYTQDAFNKYLGDGKPAYVPKLRLSPEEAIKMILKVGGIPVVAHPNFGNINRRSIKSLVKAGLKGIEVFHPSSSAEKIGTFKKLASDLGLLITGGSDFHGLEEKNFVKLGSIKIPYSSVVELKKYKNELDSNRTGIFAVS
ncbi:MAG: hypothetical protein BWY26_00305 [Elusimicrobia bacterium ADurb.Bin231]|nr:MAG: hypothetical protein BWY26_00305 [Elusimicrobia bacterium ADurb.Bin231]